MLLSILTTSLAWSHPHDRELAGAEHEVEHAAELYLEGQAEAAVVKLNSALAELRSRHGDAARELIIPLGFLGAALEQLGRNEQALTTVRRAIELSHLHLGENNSDQISLLYVEAELLHRLGQGDATEQRLQRALELTRRHHGSDSVEAGLALGRLAEGLGRNGAYEASLSLFNQALDLINRHAGEEEGAEVVVLLQGMAQLHLDQGQFPERSLPLLQRMVEATEAHPQRFDSEARIEAILLYGDLLMRFSRENQAVAQYRRAWRVARDSGNEVWLQRFSQPQRVAGRLKSVDQPPAQGEYFRFRYDLAADGRPSQVELLHSNTDPAVSRWALQQFREMRFRPPLVDGKAVALSAQKGVFVY